MTTRLPFVALIGLGRMGAAMARRIGEAGYPLILWNRDSAKTEQTAVATGGRVASSAADATQRSDIVVSSLADDEALMSVYLGEGGVLEGLTPDKIAVDTSTVSPGTIHQVGEAVDGTGASFVDCPVSGSVSTVESGALTVMAGGDQTVIDAVEPVLATMASKIIRVGGRGSGAACKLAVNSLVHGLNVALSEALVLAERAGVDRSTAYEVFVSGAGGAPFVHYKRAAYENPEDGEVAFSLDLVKKDLELITQLGRDVGAPLRQATTGFEIVSDAVASGFGDHDLSAIAVYLREGGA